MLRVPGSRQVITAVGIGLLASASIAIGGLLDGWAGPNGAWFVTSPLGSHPTTGKALTIVGAVALCAAWLALLRCLRRRRAVPVRMVAVLCVLWALPLAIAPPLFSKDVYAYAAYGELKARGVDPYSDPPEALARGTYLAHVDPLYRGVKALDGPAMIGVDAAAVVLSGHSEFGTIELLRVVELAALILAAYALTELARGAGREPSRALALTMANPITLLALVAPANNHTLMIGLLAAGLALHKRGHPWPAIALCTLAGAIKAPALLGVAYIGWSIPADGSDRIARVRSLVGACVAGAVGFAAIALVLGLGWGWVSAIREGIQIPTAYTPSWNLALVIERMARKLSLGTAHVLGAVHDLGYALIALATVAMLWTSTRTDEVRKLALTLLVVVALGPTVLPYWLCWGVLPLIAVSRGRYLALAISLSVLGALLMLPQASTAIFGLGLGGEILVLVLAGALALIPTEWAAIGFARLRGSELA